MIRMLCCRGASAHASRHVVRKVPRQAGQLLSRAIHYDGRNRLSNFWTPTQLASQSDHAVQPTVHDLLIKAGFLRQAHSGIFHLLPLGLRVQDKIEKLIDKHIISLGASKVSLSSLSSEELWTRSGRLEGRDSEFLRLTDRKGARYLLSPTHEEEITTIVANAIKSYKDLPLRLYQVSRKYRDEARPRQGLLRGREFLMKDLYTFDATEEAAIATYADVRKAYCAFLDELKLPYLVADADSGKMGGNLSHEYHFVSSSGEDNVVTCSGCGYAVNEELFAAPYGGSTKTNETEEHNLISKDRKELFTVIVPKDAESLNLHIIKRLLPEIDTGVHDVFAAWKQANPDTSPPRPTILADPRCDKDSDIAATIGGREVLLTGIHETDTCPKCSETSLSMTQAVEIGHTFHLSTRYSQPLGAMFKTADNKDAHVQMGCHGIGVSRLIAAVSGLLTDTRGLNWPLAVAPFGVVMIPTTSIDHTEIVQAYDTIKDALPTVDLLIDDRQRQFGWKLNDADLVGYPFLVILGRKWSSNKQVELQCRRLGVKQDVDFSALPDILAELSATL